jgi:hypothetical protein
LQGKVAFQSALWPLLFVRPSRKRSCQGLLFLSLFQESRTWAKSMDIIDQIKTHQLVRRDQFQNGPAVKFKSSFKIHHQDYWTQKLLPSALKELPRMTWSDAEASPRSGTRGLRQENFTFRCTRRDESWHILFGFIGCPGLLVRPGPALWREYHLTCASQEYFEHLHLWFYKSSWIAYTVKDPR